MPTISAARSIQFAVGGGGKSMEEGTSIGAPIVGVVDVALTFPGLIPPSIDRPHLLETIDSIFDAGVECVLLEGAEQMGKTYLAAQFAQSHAAQCVSVFLGSFNTIAADPAQIRYDLGNQIHWYLTGRRLEIDVDVDSETFRNLMFLLQRRVRVDRRPVYFVIDGVDGVASNSPGLQYLLTSSLPIGSPGFRFVLSESSTLLAGSRSRAKVRPHTLSPFSLVESQRFFDGLSMEPETVSEIHRTLRGVPGHLSAVRRLIESGHSPQEILDNVGDGAPDIFEPEWRCIDTDNDALLRTLSAIAFLPECSDLKILSTILNVSGHELIAALRGVSFVRVDDKRSSVAFVSDSFQRYARRKLARYENEMLDAAIRRLTDAADTSESLRLLPDYLQRRNRLTDLSAYLSSRRISDSVVTNRSVLGTLSMLSGMQDRAFAANAEEVGLRCIFARLVLSDMMPSDLMESRVEAALSQKNDSLAISIANSAELNEQRLALLALVGRVQRTRGTEADPAVVEEIRRLASATDFRALGEHAIGIAADLALCAPDLATRALESFAVNQDDANALDMAIVRSTVRALRNTKDESDVNRLFSEVDKLARSDIARRVMRSAALLWKQDDATAILDGISTLTTTSERLFFARQWLRVNSRCEISTSVALGVTRQILADTAYAPNATVFRDLSLPLVHSKESEDANRLLTFLDGQSEYARNRGPLTDYFRMRLRIARTRLKWSGPDALVHYEDEALAIDAVADMSVRAACYAWLIRSLHEAGVGEAIPDSIGLISYARSELHKAMDRLLSETADHTEAIEVVLRALARSDADEAISIVSRVNTAHRRDESYVEIGESLLGEPETSAKVIRDTISKLLPLIDDTALREELATKYLSWVADNAADARAVGFTLRNASDVLIHVQDPDVRARSLAAAVGVLAPHESPEALQLARRTIVSSWEAIEDDSLRTRTGYRVLAAMAPAGSSVVGTFAADLNSFVEPRLPNLEMQETWYQVLLLKGRATAALAAVRSAKEDDLAELDRLAGNILSQVERARYLSCCALYLAQVDEALAKKLVGDYVAPKLAEVMNSDAAHTTEGRRLIVACAPAIWLHHPPSLLRYLGRCDFYTRQWALETTLGWVLRDRIPGEPWNDRTAQQRQLNEAAVSDVITLLREVQLDTVLTGAIEDLCERARDRHAGARLNPNQKANLVATIRQIAREKLPSQKGIQHDGYLLFANAAVLSVDQSSRHPDWEAIVQGAKGLPNLSDSCYVLTLLCKLIPRKWDALRRTCFDEAVGRWRRLPTVEERLSRLESMSDACSEFYEPEIRALLKESLTDFSPESSPAAADSYRSLVEIAHKMDEEWAASLVSVTDTDPARQMSREEAKERLGQLKIQAHLADSGDEAVIKAKLDDVARACWDELGIVNASRTTALDWDSMMSLLRRASEGSLLQTYPIVAFVLASACAKYHGALNAAEKVRFLYNAVSHAAEIMLGVSKTRADATVSPTSELLRTSSYLFHVAEPGTREQVFASLAQWLRDSQVRLVDVVDPYYRADDSDMLALFARTVPDCQIRVLTSLAAQEPGCSASRLAEALHRAWKDANVPGDAPQVALYVVGRATDGHMGIHDRWWLAGSGGLEFGTSLNGLGRDKTSVIRTIDTQEVLRLRAIVDPYFQMLKRSHEGQRLSYLTATL